MTSIVGLESEGRVYIGGDSAGVNSLDLQNRRDEKVFLNRGIAFGFTTSFRMGQILRYAFVPPKRSRDDSDMKYLVTDFIDAVRSSFKDHGFIQKDSGADQGGCFLLGYRGKLYMVDTDFQVAHMQDGFMAVGCGGQIALGAMYATNGTSMKPRERIANALSASERYNAAVRGPFTIVSTARAKQ